MQIVLTTLASAALYVIMGMSLMVIITEALRLPQGRRFHLFSLYYVLAIVNEILFVTLGERFYFAHVVIGSVLTTCAVVLLAETPFRKLRTLPVEFGGLLVMGVVLVFTVAFYAQRVVAGQDPYMRILATVNVFLFAIGNGVFVYRRFGEESYGYIAVLVLWLFSNFGFTDPSIFVNRVFAVLFFGSVALHVGSAAVSLHRQVVHENAMYLKARDVVSSMLHELSTAVKDIASIDSALHCVLDTTIKTAQAAGAAVFLVESGSQDESFLAFSQALGDFWPVHESSDVVFTKRKYAEHALEESAFKIGEGIVGTVAKYRTHAVLDLNYHRTEMERLGLNTRAIKNIMAVPFQVKDQVLGVLVVQNKHDDSGFDANDLHLIQALADQAAVSINNFKIYAQLAESEKMRQEMQIAARIQTSLLPLGVPDTKNLGVSAFMKPAKEVGGDYYDFIPYDEDKLGVVIGDVSGKGLPAGMIMIIANAIIKIVAVKTHDTKRIITEFSKEMHSKIQPGSFMTMNYLIWDGAARKLSYSGAGHEHIILYRKQSNDVERIKAGGLAVGLLDNVDGYISQNEIQTDAGDVIVLYTDGITEAVNSDRERYTLDRLVASVRRNVAKKDHERIRQGILDDVFEFMGGYEQYDDITLLVMRVL
ncbi:MAG: SpoIIE family protein phosphatase [Chitinivibrionales bacterium]|nr:SpoIIE family protein phosphatase [Chitinivibrionales bacterium]MBD3394424.1 SpoIIE family protein phosphatase [Chitinivibrionales bacterium]